jgi:protease-4
MKSFAKIIFASMIGTFLSLFLLFIFMISLVGVLSAGRGQWEDDLTAGIEKNSVLRIDLNGPLKDHVKRKDLVSTILRYDDPPVTGLYEVGQVLKKAATDNRIRGLLLNFKSFQSGLANAEALRRYIVQFKESGKFVIAYAESYREVDYIVASAVDEVILYPKGLLEWNGIAAKPMFFKHTLEKLDITPQIFRVGKYKSAIERFSSDKMSAASREQTKAIIDGAWTQLLKYAGEKTKLSSDQLNSMAEEFAVFFAKDALEVGFVNLLASFEEVEEKLKELTGQEEKPKYVSWRSYYKEVDEENKARSGDSIALIFAEGGIGVDAGDGDRISSDELSKLIHEIRHEDDVKAVVIRVNSPGGSSLASDVIWTSTQWLKDSKPVVSSFGNVAASGGYYMSAGSQAIFAEPTTITGSIGVFGILFSTEDFWNEHIGATFDTVKSHKFADMESLYRLLNDEERSKIQLIINSVYEDFLNVVTDGRPAYESTEDTHKYAQGRVWNGTDAKEIGLVDELGGVEEAILKAAELAKISDYKVEVYPKELSPFQEFFKQLSEASVLAIQSIIPEKLRLLWEVNQEGQPLHSKIMTRMPYDIEIL